MKSKYNKNYSSIIEQIKKIYCEIYKGKKAPNILNKLCYDLLLIKPEIFLFKAIEIKTYYKDPEKELDKCFPGDDYVKKKSNLKQNI